jgi:hypothetical protein
MRDSICGCYGAERFLLLHHTMYDYRPKVSRNTIVRMFRPWSPFANNRRRAGVMSFIVSEQVLYLEIQFARRGKEEIENWRQRTRHPSVPLRLFMYFSRISRTNVLHPRLLAYQCMFFIDVLLIRSQFPCPSSASLPQPGCFCTIDGLARMFRVSIQVGESHYTNDLFWQTKHFLFLVLLDLDATPGSYSRCG